MEYKPLLSDKDVESGYYAVEKRPADQQDDDVDTDQADSVFCGAWPFSLVFGLFGSKSTATPLPQKTLVWIPGAEPPVRDPHDITDMITFRRARPFAISPCSDLFKHEHHAQGTVVVRRVRFQEEDEAEENAYIRNYCDHLFELRHAYVLPYLGFCEFEGSVCFVSPFVEGGDLRQFVDNYPDCDRKAIISEVATALAYLHDRGIVHGNLHSRNVLMSEYGQAMLTDFGLSDIIPDDGTTSMRPYFAREKIMHRAPEIHMGALHSAPGDVYSFAMLVFTVYCDDEPMIDQYPGTIQVAAALMAGWRPDRSEIAREDFSERIWTMVQWCWASDPQARPAIWTAYVNGLLEFDI